MSHSMNHGIKDEQEIRTARATLGNFQLKTSSDYVVPEHLRSNTKQKKRRIAAITLNIYETKKVFNEKVLPVSLPV